MPDLVPHGAAALGISRDTAYSLARTDSLPVQVVRLGRCMKVRRAELITFLGIREDNGDGAWAATQTPLAERTTATTGK
ncbi:helix-turn-helix domain-containing protein [Streptomyces sp. NBC_01283]|uniref:helix-turn-helix domain-containing protein n=1 Tax=Streptomyces sp. NBC_01283 TaxID=2903812 RepID=UPI00352F1586|nr:helix-turn-helix domain-containing protein [Streptomyces sp. NBC_01283]